jgi:hypothetical protein
VAGALLTLALSLSAQEVRQQRVPTDTVALIVLQATVITGLLAEEVRHVSYNLYPLPVQA